MLMSLYVLPAAARSTALPSLGTSAGLVGGWTPRRDHAAEKLRRWNGSGTLGIEYKGRSRRSLRADQSRLIILYRRLDTGEIRGHRRDGSLSKCGAVASSNQIVVALPRGGKSEARSLVHVVGCEAALPFSPTHKEEP